MGNDYKMKAKQFSPDKNPAVFKTIKPFAFLFVFPTVNI